MKSSHLTSPGPDSTRNLQSPFALPRGFNVQGTLEYADYPSP